jgi:cell division septation protein DedD
MVDHNERNQSPDDLYDEAAPRSIFAATWFRAVLVLIVLGVVGAVAVPYILDAMNAPPGKLIATGKPSPPPASQPQAPPVMAPPAVTSAPGATPAPSTPALTTTTPPAAETTSKPTATKDPVTSGAAPETTKPEPVKPEPKPSPTATVETPSKAAPKAARSTASASRSATGGEWFVQVGAFKDPATAKAIAAKLREDSYKVDESVRGASPATVSKATTTPPAAAGARDQYDVIISGQSPADLGGRLGAKGLSAEATANGAVVKPSLPLRDAVALSKELAVDGLKVQVRRAGGASAPAARSSRPSAADGSADTLHRVSVGGFADRATALATLKELEGKGYKPFLTRR